MRCEDAAERITALVDGELPAEERRDLESHLASCPACREARAAEEAVAARLRALPRPPLPAGFAAGVMDRVRAGDAPGEAAPSARILPMWPAFAAAAAVAAAVVAMVIVGPGASRRGSDVAHLDVRSPAAGAPAPSAMPSPAAERPSLARERQEAKEGKGVGKFKDEEVPAREGGERARDAEEATVVADAAAPAAKPAADAGAGAPGGGPDAPSAPSDAPQGAARAVTVVPPASPAPAPPAEPAAAAPAPGQGLGGAKSAAAPAKKAEPALPRTPLFFRVADLRGGKDAVEKALFAQKDLALAKNPWRPAREFQATVYGRLRKGVEMETAGNQVAAVVLPDDQVLELRVRTGDLPRLRAVLSRTTELRPGPDVPIEGTGESVPAEILVAVRNLRQARDDAGALGEATGEEASDATKAGADSSRAEPAKPDGGGGLAGGREPGEPQPPPALTADALRLLEKAPRPPSPTGLAAAAGTDEIWVEIHLILVPPPARPPK